LLCNPPVYAIPVEVMRRAGLDLADFLHSKYRRTVERSNRPVGAPVQDNLQ
jgi:hypothetical protein